MCGLLKKRPFHASELFKLGLSLLISAAIPSQRTGGVEGNYTSPVRAYPLPRLSAPPTPLSIAVDSVASDHLERIATVVAPTLRLEKGPLAVVPIFFDVVLRLGGTVVVNIWYTTPLD